MIDPACFVSADRGIDHFFFVVEPKIVCPHILEIFRNISPQNTAPGIFDDARAFPDRSGRKNAAAMHWRSADFQRFAGAIFRIGRATLGSALLWSSLRHKMNSKFVDKMVAPIKAG